MSVWAKDCRVWGSNYGSDKDSKILEKPLPFSGPRFFFIYDMGLLNRLSQIRLTECLPCVEVLGTGDIAQNKLNTCLPSWGLDSSRGDSCLKITQIST